MSDNSLPQSDNGDTVDTFATIPDVSIQAISSRVNPNQVASGLTRGAQVISGADGNPQVLMGSQQTFGNGFYVAKPAIDVITNTDPANLIFNSNQNVFKIVQSGTASFNSNFPVVAGPAGAVERNIVTVNHNLGYVPGVLVYYVFNNGVTYYPITHNSFYDYNFSFTATGEYQLTRYVVELTTTTLVVGLERSYFVKATHSTDGSTGVPYVFKYYLLQETAN